jgi:hypothetical protein
MIDLLKQLAPTVVSFFGTPAAGAATKLLIDAFDGDEQKVNDIVNGRTELTSEDIAKIKVAELEAQTKKSEFEYLTKKLAFDNVNDALDMQKEALKQDDVFSKRFVYYFSWFWSFAAVAYLLIVTLMTIPPENVRVVDTILGFLLGTIVATIINYHMGTSASSDRKTELLGK